MTAEFLTRLDSHPRLSAKFAPVTKLLKDFRKSRDTRGHGSTTPSRSTSFSEESEFIQTKVLPQVFSSISRLNSSEFDNLVEELLTFALLEWEKERCFTSLRILGQIFGYISRLAPKPVVNEFLLLFSRHDAQPHVKYFLLPEVAKNLKHSAKNAIEDNILYHLIYFAKMKKTQESVSLVDPKFIHPFWLQLQCKWTDTIAGNLIPVFVEMVDILPFVSLETLSEVKKAMASQFVEEDIKVPILTLLAISILVMGFRQFDYSDQDAADEWEELTKIIRSVIKFCCSPGIHDSSPSTKELRYFIVRILSTFLSSVPLDSLEMLTDIITSVPVITTIAIPSERPKVHQNTTTAPLSHDTITEHLDQLEELVDKLKVNDAASLSSPEKARVLRAVAELKRVCQ